MKSALPVLLAIALSACATTDDDVAPGRVGTTSNAPAGAAAASNAGTRAVGAYGALNTSDDVRGRWSVERTFTPQMDMATREALHAGWRRAVERARAWAQP